MALKNPLAIRRKLLRWYGKHRRDLPWRKTNDPYAIWIAETMLQQTQVSTVEPYYERFLRQLPSVHALHRARLRKVLTLWSGLGYYRRAENLKKSANEIVRKHGGQLPEDYNALLALPGVGGYTAGALMSIAFQQPFPAIDGNARRVLYRLLNPKNDNELRQFAALLVPRARPGYFNQGLMELGATICIPRNPRCPRCPLDAHCAARAKGRPIKSFRIAKSGLTQDIEWPLAIVRQEGKILLRQRTRKGLLAGLWEFPGGEKPPRHSQRDLLASQLAELSARFRPERRIGEFRHSITNRKIRSPVFLLDLPNNTKLQLPNRRWRWLSPASLREFAVSSMTFKAATILANHEKNSS
jgi:A/G-specific adenine glycosylase